MTTIIKLIAIDEDDSSFCEGCGDNPRFIYAYAHEGTGYPIMALCPTCHAESTLHGAGGES